MITIGDVDRYRWCRTALRKLREDESRMSLYAQVQIEAAYYGDRYLLSCNLPSQLGGDAKIEFGQRLLEWGQRAERLGAQAVAAESHEEIRPQLFALDEEYDKILEDAIATVASLNEETVA